MAALGMNIHVHLTHEGHSNRLKYAHENGCPWNDPTCSNTALSGHSECLKYAHENGCPCEHNKLKI